MSQPSIPGFGIDAMFARTDQKYFLLRCARCGGSLDSKRILFYDSNACERCDPQEEPPARL